MLLDSFCQDKAVQHRKVGVITHFDFDLTSFFGAERFSKYAVHHILDVQRVRPPERRDILNATNNTTQMRPISN